MDAEVEDEQVDVEHVVIGAVRELFGAPPLTAGAVAITGPGGVLPSVFDVTGFATGAIAAATVAAAELLAVRSGVAVAPVSVDRRRASAAFICEGLFTPIGWERPAVWDPIAGDYACADGWIRLHTNYSYHRTAALAALGIDDVDDLDRDAVAPVVATWRGDELERAVVERNGCAAVLRDHDAWRAHPGGAATAAAPVMDIRRRPGGARPLPSAAGAPLDGVRVLDLTRVIAGPVCTRFLAGYGADVLRIDPPRFAEVGALLPITTAGKRVCELDLRSAMGRQRFEQLVAEADVIVSGFRPGALDDLGLTTERLAEINPSIITARLDAYGWVGPWAGRRGFDSLVQMSCGIAAAGQRISGSPGPRPLPAQALDHGTGYLLAAAVCHALADRVATGMAADITASLAGTAALLMGFPAPDGLRSSADPWNQDDTELVETHWGPARAVPAPGTIDGVRPRPLRPARPLGADTPAFAVPVPR